MIGSRKTIAIAVPSDSIESCILGCAALGRSRLCEVAIGPFRCVISAAPDLSTCGGRQAGDNVAARIASPRPCSLSCCLRAAANASCSARGCRASRRLAARVQRGLAGQG